MAKQKFPETWVYAKWMDIHTRLLNGTITADQLRKEYADFYARIAEVMQLIDETTTKAELQANFYRRLDAKSDGVTALTGKILNAFIPDGAPNPGIDGMEFYKKKPAWQIHGDHNAKILEKVTDEMIQAAAQKVQAKKEKVQQALIDPQDIDDFRLFLGKFGFAKLSDEQLERYDALVAAIQMEEALREMERAAKVGQIHLSEGVEMLIFQEWHTKRLCDIWRVKLSEHVEGTQWKEYNEKARRFGGYWSTYGAMDKHGWIFFNEDDAAAFMDLTEGDGNVMDRWNRRRAEREQGAAMRLQEKAQTLEESALEELQRERKTNTVRRAAMAQAAWERAERDQEYVQVLAGVSAAIAKGETVFLRNIRFATQVELYEHLLTQARDAHIRATHNGGYPATEIDRQPRLDDIRYASMPWPVLSKSTTFNIVAKNKGKRGTKSACSYITRLIAAHKDKDQITFGTWEAIDSMKELFEDGKPPKYEGWYWQDIERLRVMGVKSLSFLRAALREYLLHRVVKPVPKDEIRIKELDLVGRKIAGFFPTPASIAEQMVVKAGIVGNHHMNILEPSGGSGRICDMIRKAMDPDSKLFVCEVNPTLRELLQLKGYDLVGYDFMEYNPPMEFDTILMNPPFENCQDVEHVQHAYDLLMGGGILVAIMSKHWQFANDTASVEFRQFVNQIGGMVEDLPEGSFKESGTNVPTVMVVLEKE